MRSALRLLAIATSAADLVGPAAAAEPPMGYLHAAGKMGAVILPLMKGLLAVSIAVVVIVTALVVVGVVLRARREPLTAVPVTESPATAWITIGVAISTPVLLALVVWTSITMARIANPPTEPDLTVEVRGHQWWWEFVYLNRDVSQIFETANEIHIPVGKPVRFDLKGVDVIHTFWIPSLGGKTQIIPGQTNVTWLEADRPGVYRGQCSQFCGEQHAHMILSVFADPPDVYERWRQSQLSAAAPRSTDEGRLDEATFVQRCGACHAVRGTRADGRLGPDLTHLMSRSTIAAGMLPNNPGYLSGWIADPQGQKPGALMPRPELSGPELTRIRSFLLTLK